MSRRLLPLALASSLASILACEPAQAAGDGDKTESKGDATPAEAKPAQVKPAGAKPAEATPAEVKPAEATPAETAPAAVPRPKTIAAARDRLVAIAKSGDLSHLAALVHPDRGLEHSYKQKRVWRMRLRTEDPARLAAMFTSTDASPIQHVAKMAGAKDGAFSAKEKTLTVELRPGGAGWVDFTFEALGDELVLVRITTPPDAP